MKRRQEIIAKVHDRKGNLLAIGRNSYTRTHPIQVAWAKKVGLPEKEFLHAEVDALIKAMKRGKPFKLTVERYLKNGQPGNAEPCKICKAFAKFAGIERIEYTI